LNSEKKLQGSVGWEKRISLQNTCDIPAQANEVRGLLSSKPLTDLLRIVYALVD